METRNTPPALYGHIELRRRAGRRLVNGQSVPTRRWLVRALPPRTADHIVARVGVLSLRLVSSRFRRLEALDWDERPLGAEPQPGITARRRPPRLADPPSDGPLPPMARHARQLVVIGLSGREASVRG